MLIYINDEVYSLEFCIMYIYGRVCGAQHIKRLKHKLIKQATN